MDKLVCGLAASLLLSASAVAQPILLSNSEMDRVNGGFFELDVSNTSTTAVSIFFRPYLLDPTPNTINCSSCYLQILTPTLSIASAFGQPSSPPTAPE